MPGLVGLDATLATDIATSLAAGVACVAVILWIARTPSRTFLERRTVPLLVTLAADYLLRVPAWLAPEGHLLRVGEDLVAAFHPIAMALLVEALLRRHLPLRVKWSVVAGAALTLAVALLPASAREPVYAWAQPVVMVCTLGLLATQLWRNRRAGLAREETRLIAGVVVAALLAVPLVAGDAGPWRAFLPNRFDAIAGLLFVRVLVTPPAMDGVRDALSGSLRALLRAVVIAAVVLVLLGAATPTLAAHVATVLMALLLLFEVFDRVRGRERLALEARLLRWLAAAPRDDFDGWRRALRHAPLGGDALVLDHGDLDDDDRDALAHVSEQLGPVLSDARLREAALAQPPERRAAFAHVRDLLALHDATHAGVLGLAPVRLLLANVPQVAGRDTDVRLAAIVRSGREAAGAHVRAA
ncbi:MAG: hypothetical protein HY275_12175 [Gemmatimonadetes bacterium]|nr:hypothetical protein [Gemmatimonadota bacterium]